MKRKPIGSYDPVYAIIYAYFSEDENVDDPAIYKIILSDYEFSELPEPGCYEKPIFATVYKGNIIKNLIMDCQSYTKYRPNETTGGIFVSWRRKEELPTGA